MKSDAPVAIIPNIRLDAFAMIILTMCCASWGLNQTAIKVANTGISPLFQSALRASGGTAILLAWCAVRGVPLLRRDGTLVPGIIAGILFAAEFVFLYEGLNHTTAARGVVIMFSMPFFTALGAHFFVPGERLTPVRSLGLAAAFAGLVLAFADSLSVPSADALMGDAMMLMAAILWAATTIVIKASAVVRAPPEKALIYQLGVTAITMFPLAWLVGEAGIFDPAPLVLAALAYQTVWVVAFTYVIWFWLMQRYPASHLSAFIFLTPLFGVLFGGVLLGERVSPLLGAALALVAFGIWLVNRPEKAAGTPGT